MREWVSEGVGEWVSEGVKEWGSEGVGELEFVDAGGYFAEVVE